MKRHLLTLLFFFLLLDSSLSIPLEPTIGRVVTVAGRVVTGAGRAVAGTFKNIRNSIRSDEDAEEMTTKVRDQARDSLLNHVPDLVGSQPQPGASQFRCGGFHYFLSPTQGRNWFSDRTSLTYRFNPKIQDPFAQVLRDSFRRWSEELSLPLREKRYDEHDYADITIELSNFKDNMVVGDSLIIEHIPSNFAAAVGIGHIRLADNKNWGVLNIDIDTVVMHQLGHLLGLSHSNRNDSVMNPNIWSGKPRKVFSIGEKQQIKQVYSPNGNGNGVGSSP
ncbi:metalloendoproteinase 3-MMP [Arachis duranensis]|uniref:Metalloendoproteinase 3-MMP n=1 Tax=Arachis duranensis TaxID=130453 RepID=A0A6P5NN90_ARADU|nr:metalloendoproteinase 3-MMP [Arachis duranensis]